MKFKKTLLAFCLIMCIFFCVSSVAAGDVNDTAIASENQDSVDANVATAEVDNEKIESDVISSSNEDILSAKDNGTFTALQEKINNAAENATITLENDYAYDEGFTTNGITISKSLTIDGNNHIINGLSKSRIFNVVADGVVLKNIKITNGDAGDGGAVRSTGDNFTIIKSTFTNNRASGYYAGAIDCSGDNFTIIDSTFTGNSADGDGGAVRLTGNNCEIFNCSFSNNKAIGDGGGVLTNGANCCISDSIFTNNVAVIYNGGAVRNTGDNCVIRNSRFVGNDAPNHYGGAIKSSGENFIMSNSVFIGNHALEGGAFFVSVGFYSTIEDSTFINNTADDKGGALYFDILGKVSDCTFSGNSAPEIYYNSQIPNVNLTFADIADLISSANSGDTINLNGYYYGSGSAINVDKSITLKGVGETVLDAKGLSSILSISASNVRIENIKFVNAKNSGDWGGAIYWDGDSGVLVNSTFVNNTASWGACIFWWANNGYLTDCTFEDNTAERYGGALYVNGNNLRIVSSLFKNNVVTNSITQWEGGGAIYTDGTNHLVANSTFIGNKATQSWGGAIKHGSETATFESNEFYSNSALRGNSIWDSGAENVKNNVFNLNSIDEIATCVEDANLSALFDTNVFKVNGKVISKKDYFNDSTDDDNSSSENITALTFADLQNLIDSADSGAVLVLNNDYNNVGSISEEGITISKSLTIDGKGHILDAKGKSGIFNCTAQNIILKNIIFKNGYSTNSEATVYINGYNNQMTNCSFINCSAKSVGALCWAGSSGSVSNCSFIDCYCNSYSGSIFWKGSDGSVSDCSFVNSYGEQSGAINWQGERGTVFGCNFDNCSSYWAGAISWWKSNGNLYNCSFINCFSEQASAISWKSKNGNLYNCSFINCFCLDSYSNGALYLESSDNSHISNCTFINCDGQGMYIFSDNCIVFNCSFMKCHGYFTGAIHMQGSNTILHCNFVNCYSEKYGGAIRFTDYRSGIEANIIDCSFNDCYALNGGGIYWNYHTGSVSNCTFINCNSSNSGGGIYLSDSGNIFGCSFENCSTSKNGGAIFANSKNCQVSNSSFMDCNAENEGGAIYWNVTGGNIDNSSFSHSKAQHGGAIFVDKDILLTISNSKFEYNTAKKLGGAIYFNTIGNVINCTFNGNSDPEIYPDEEPVDNATFKNLKTLIDNAKSGDIIELNCDYFNDGSISEEGITISKSLTIDGKGHILDAKGKSRIFKLSADNIVLKNMTFINGYSTGHGGAIYNTDNFKISSCNFINCFAGDCGGAIDNADGSTSNIISCNFTDCRAIDGGGGVYNEDNSHHITFCSFVNCSCDNYGGAIGNGGFGDRYISSCSFVNCSSSNYGGAIDNGADCNIILCSFDNCSAGSGGAIFINFFGTCDDISSCSFTNCSASNSGGAIYNIGECQIISSCLFTRCYAEEYGGAIYNEDSDGTISSCNFTDCHTDDVKITSKAAICNIDGALIVKNCNYIDTITPAPIATFIVSSPVTTVYNGNKYLVATLKDIDGNALRGFEVSVDFNGVKKLTTNKNGQVKISTNGLTAKTYDVLITFAGNENYTESNTTTTVVINKDSTKLSASAVTTIYNANKNLVITLKDSQGKALNGVKLSVNLNGAKPYTTDKNGQVKIAVGSLVPKAYTAKISFAGNDNYKASSATAKVTVNKATPKLTAKAQEFKKSVKTKKYTVTLKTNQNKVMKNTKVTIKVNKKTYTAKTNSKGVATFKITKLTKKGKYTATVTYKGNSYYNKLTKKVKITIK